MKLVRKPETDAELAHGVALVLATVADLQRMKAEILDAIKAPAAPALPQLLTRNQAAEWLCCSPATVDNMRRKGMPCVWLGDSPRFEPGAVVEWMRARGSR